MDTLSLVIGSCFGIVIGFLLGAIVVFLKKRGSTDLAGQIEIYKTENLQLKSENEAQRQNNYEVQKLAAIAQKETELLKDQIEQRKQEVSQLEEKFKSQFENLAQKIFEEKQQKWGVESSRNIKELLDPLKEKISQFQIKVENTYRDESRERFALKKEIERIVQTNEQMSLEAQNLTKALRGDVKAQGNWGEVILQRLLEVSGLREGQEFTTQGRQMKLQSEEGKRQQPDVIVNLPDNKHLIIDSKVSLTHYENFVSAEDIEDKEKWLKQFQASIYAHVENLSGKKYQYNQKLVTPEFVLLFFPIEGAFSLAIQNDPKLFTFAWEKSIVIVSPTTLLATLKTIASIWKQEKQNRNALKIARESGLLYDKFVGFMTDLEKIGESIKRADNHYNDAFNKLRTGKGNIIGKVENLKTLGAKTSKKIDEQHFMEEH